MWHNDLATVAIENLQLSCLKYIVEFMGNYCVDFNDAIKNDECVEYILSKNIVGKQMPKI